MIDPLSGISAVTNAATIGRPGVETTRDVAVATNISGGKDFSALIGDAITGLSSQLRASEAVSLAGLKGTASTQDVVEQLMVAEHSLQSAIAVRDKIVAAYLEIGRMAI